MAGVLDSMASYIQNMLTEMAKDEVHMLLGVSGEIEKMDIKLKDLKNFLADADRRNITDQSVQAWVGELRDAMYEATNILDDCQLKAMERGQSHDARCLNPLLYCMRNPLHAHKIGSRIKNLNQSLEDIKKRSKNFGFIDLSLYKDRSRREVRSRPSSRETTGELDESSLVGEKIEEDTRNLVEMLTIEDEKDKIMVFAIVGAGGIGKTTLAQKIFNHDIIQREFPKKIWLSVTQDFSGIELLTRATIEAGGDNRSVGNRTMLERALQKALDGQKTLLVMDDVWDFRAWEDVLKIPLVNAAQAQGCRVLVTTRHDAIARRMVAKKPYYNVSNLEPEDAWLLLKKQVVGNKNDEAPVETLKDIGLEIVKKCDCLPLAVKVMGGFLRQKRIRQRDWENILNDWSVSQMPEELNYAIYLSYQDLHPCLKPCFLHYSLLPKNTLFVVDDIIAMWISEGFLHAYLLDLEEKGREYYDELIQRNLIEPDKAYTDQQVCNMQEVVRSFAQYVARYEALAAYNVGSGLIDQINSQKLIRLSLETKESESNELEWSYLQGQTSLRTLISVGHINIKPGDSLVSFSSLRTLHVQHVTFDLLAESLYQLKHLRYLSIEYTNTSVLPENIGKVKFLQYISLLGCQSLAKLPRSIGRLQNLRFLELSGTSITSNNLPRGLCGLTNLRKLYGFPAQTNGDWCSLEELGPLSQLSRLHICGLENVSSSCFAMKARLHVKMHLSYLFLSCASTFGNDSGSVAKEEKTFFEEKQRKIEEVFDELCPPICIENIAIKGYFGQRFPRWMTSAYIPLMNLRILTMEDVPFCTDLPDGLCNLPCLDLLQVKSAPSVKRIGPEFLQPNNNPDICSKVGTAFPRLRELNFERMVGWEEWEWEEKVQAMPILDELLLKKCKLKCFPPGLASSVRALKKLYIYNAKHLDYLENFASVVYLEVRHNPQLQRISNVPKLQKLEIIMCPNIKVLEGMPTIQRLGLEDYDMKIVPGYLLNVNPKHLQVRCTLSLLTSIATGESSPEREKFIHIQQLKAYAPDGDIPMKWFVLYERDPFTFKTNISHSAIAREIGHQKRKLKVLEQSNLLTREDTYMELHVLERIHDGIEEPTNLKLTLLELITEKFSRDRRIGHGGCGEVYKGILPTRIVAVKRLFNSHTMEDKMFDEEVKSMMLVKHQNIVRFLGYCSDTQRRAVPVAGKIVMAEERERLLCFEYVSNGSLEKYKADELRGLEWHTRYQIMKGICEGLHYLHKEKHIIHMDLKPANILIDDRMVPKISDFGISRLEGTSQTTSSQRFGSLGYCDPEYLFKGRMSIKSDIYSLGIIIIEMVTGSKEKPNIAKVLRRWRHRWNSHVPLWYLQVTKSLELGLRCSQEEPLDRPYIWDVIQELNEIDIGGVQIRDSTGTTSDQISRSFLTHMLGIEPLEIHFPFAPDKQATYSIKLNNDTHDYIAFRISPTNSLLQYSTQPEKGIVQPESKCRVKITFQGQEKAPVPSHFIKEEFCVQSTRVDDSLTAMDITQDMFNEELDKVVDKVNLPVIFDAQQ